MTHNFDFSKFKQEINLTQYAAHLGYEIDRKKSTKSSVAMILDADKIIISKRGGVWVYFSVFDDSDNGTIIDFIQNRTSKTIFEIAQELETWIGGGESRPDLKSYVFDVKEQEKAPARIKKIFSCCSPAIKHAYIESRGISSTLLQSKRFTGRIYVDNYQNAVFPHYRDNKICGLELKNASKALFVRGSEKTFWRSNFKHGDDTLIIGEAVIDVLSHSILFPNANAVYAATGGGMSPAQGDVLKYCVNSFKSLRTIILAMDNDEGGDRLSHKIEKILENSNFTGNIIRHSPKAQGQDWNDVLQAVE